MDYSKFCREFRDTFNKILFGGTLPASRYDVWAEVSCRANAFLPGKTLVFVTDDFCRTGMIHRHRAACRRQLGLRPMFLPNNSLVTKVLIYQIVACSICSVEIGVSAGGETAR